MEAEEAIKQGLINTGLVKQGSDWDQVFDGEIGYAARGIVEALDKACPGWQNVSLYREQAKEAAEMHQELRDDYNELLRSISWDRPECCD